MGAEVVRAVEAADDLQLVAAVDVGDDRAAVEGADVVVDFTHPDAVLDNIAWCLQHGLAVVVDLVAVRRTLIAGRAGRDRVSTSSTSGAEWGTVQRKMGNPSR
jgi:4-hydroxy-tetrahydrodipicolinate reductase